ncbi:hypothetical protein EDD79_10486 [Serpentinicella alkaliphila]|uniref:Uncharacterized protein n=1 Tax=Serpentinicella alkaliphila TaxID=1734049 RepID=A0A4R2T215_9FIRM|nr:hypothetical protein EDD79_10486 [Serpentinicella alkaliphila]
MLRKSKVSKEVKIQTCEDYHIEKKGIERLDQEVG